MEMSPTNNLSAYFRLLSNPLKQKIIAQLYKQSMPVKTLAEHLSDGGEVIPLPTISNAVSTLKKYGLVSKSRGRSHICSANRDTVDQFLQAAAASLHGESPS